MGIHFFDKSTMKSTLKQQVLLGILVGLGIISKASGDDGINFCAQDMCFCDFGLDPIQIDCNNLHLKILYEEADWTATFNANNVTSNRTLSVSFDDNQIEDIPRFPSLNILTLTFHRNKISTISPSAFASLERLQSLSLTDNQLTAASLFEGVFYGLFNNSAAEPGYYTLPLTHLNLSHNNIHSIDSKAFDHLRGLISLDLSSNPLKVLSNTARAIAGLQNLQFLGLRNTSISTIPEGMLHDLKNLTALELSFNKFTTVPAEIGNTHSLYYLDLDGNKFETLDKTSFAELSSLTDLNIRYVNTLRTIEEGTFSPLTNLEKLEISFNRRLDEIHDNAFIGLYDPENKSSWRIKDLRLNDNGLTHIDRGLAPWEYIDFIDIQNNPFRCDCNLEWLVGVLVERIRLSTPIVALDLTCAEPKDMKGKSLESLSLEPELFSRCRSGGGSLNPDEYETLGGDPYRAASVTILVIGILLIIIGVSVLGFAIIKRRAISTALSAHSQIRYERADTVEDGEFGDGSRKYNGPSSIYK